MAIGWLEQGGKEKGMIRWEKWTGARSGKPHMLWQDFEFCYFILSVIGGSVCVWQGGIEPKKDVISIP